MTYVLDTHPIVWFLEGSGRLSAQAGIVLRAPSHRFILPTMVLVEITYLYSKGRIAVDAIIVATALVYRDILHEPVAVITKNGEITRAGLINTVW
jgi:PIN domain nuclease of toxin-antitoxin system